MKRLIVLMNIVLIIFLFTASALAWDSHPGRGWGLFGSDANSEYYYLPGGAYCTHGGSICYCQMKQVNLNSRTSKSSEFQVKCASRQTRLCYTATQCTAWQSASKLMSSDMFARICSKR